MSLQQNSFPVAVRTMGIIALSLMLIGLIPCLGWVNYFNFAFSFVTVVLAIVALATATNDSARYSAIIGLVLNSIIMATLTERAKLHYLPAYSPKDNPVERVWWHLREQVTRNHRCQDIDELVKLTLA